MMGPCTWPLLRVKKCKGNRLRRATRCHSKSGIFPVAKEQLNAQKMAKEMTTKTTSYRHFQKM